MRKLFATFILLLGMLLGAQPLLAANPACGGCCEAMDGKAMAQCLSLACQACANAPCLQAPEPHLPASRAVQARPAANEPNIPSPATEIWTPPD